MIKLRNRGKYDPAIEEEFDYFSNRLGILLSQIFDQDGNFIQQSGLGDMNFEVYQNDVNIGAGNTTGTSTLPFTLEPLPFGGFKGLLIKTGERGNGSMDATIKILNATTIQAERFGNLQNLNVSYQLLLPPGTLS